MTDCCLLVCCRPRTFSRLVGDIYPKGSTGYERDLAPNKLQRLCAYAAAYPGKAEFICGQLLKDMAESIVKGKFGYTKITADAFVGLVGIAYTTDVSFVIEPFHRKALSLLLSCSDYPIHGVALTLLSAYTRQNDGCAAASFVEAVLDICNRGIANNSSNADEQSVGLEMLLRIIEALLSNPGIIEQYCAGIAAICCHYLSVQRVCFSTGDASSSGVPRSPAVLATQCLVVLGSVSSPRTLACIFTALFAKFDNNFWEPIAPPIKAIDLVLSSSIFLNRFYFPLCSLLISHARVIATNVMTWSDQAKLDSFLGVILEEKEANSIGSENAIRTVSVRAKAILSILTVAETLSARMQSISGVKAKDNLIFFNCMSLEQDCKHLLELLFFCSLHSGGQNFDETQLPHNSIVCLESTGKKHLLTSALVASPVCEVQSSEIISTAHDENILHNISQHCLRLLYFVFSTSCTNRRSTVAPVSGVFLHMPLSNLFSYVRNLSDRFPFLSSRFRNGNEDEYLGCSIAMSMQQTALHAINMALCACSKSICPAKSTLSESVSSGYEYIFPQFSDDNFPDFASAVGREGLQIIFAALDSPSFSLYRLAASSIIHLIAVLFSTKTTSNVHSLSSCKPPVLSLHALNPLKCQEFSIETMLSCLYKMMFRDLTVFDEISHSEKVATSWLIQKRIIKCIGLKELVYGIPFISAIFKYWKAFEFSSSISIIENRSFYHCVELLSCQALLSAAYFRTISEVISSADLHLTSVQLEKECVRLFPNIIADDPIRSCGRRLILLAGTEFEITSRSEDPNVVTISQLRVTSGTLNDISAFLKTRFDIHSITESLFVDVGNLVKLLFSAALNDYFGFTPPPETSFAFIDQFVSDLNMLPSRQYDTSDVDSIFDALRSSSCNTGFPFKIFNMKFEAENFLSKGGKEYSRSLQLASISAASIYNPREMLPKSYILHPKNLSSEEGNRKVESGPLIDINYKFESLAEIENVGSFASVTVVSTIDDCKEDSFNGSLKGGVDSLHRFLNSDDKTADSNDFSDTEFVDANPGDECWNDAKIPVRKMTAAPRKRNLTHQFSSPALKNADSYELISNKVLSPMSTSNVSIGSAAWSAMLSVFSPARTQELGALSGKASGTFSFEKLHSSFNNVEKIDLIKQEASTIVTHTSLDKPVVENRNLYGSRSLMSRL